MSHEDREALLQRISALEQALSEREREDRQQDLSVSLLQAALEATADGILIVDSQGKVAGCNSRFIELWRIPPELMAAGDDRKLIGYVLDQLQDPAVFLSKVEALYKAPLDESFDVLQFKDERIFERFSRPQLLNGEAVGRVWSFRDITQRRRAEQEAARSKLQEQIIAAQAAALSQLSTPLIPISDQVMVMPLIGAIDSDRANQVLDTLLSGIAGGRARIAIVDITGVAVVDTHVAGALIRAAQAVKLLGAEVILTGIRAEVAQTLVGLGMNLGGLVTRSTLQTGIAYALSRCK